MTDEELLDTSTELKPKRKRGPAGPYEGDKISPLRDEEPETVAPHAYPQVVEPEISDIDNETQLKIAEMWADEVKDRTPLVSTGFAPVIKGPEPTRPKGLHAKLAEVMAIAGRIPKRGKAPAAMGGFEFVQVGDAADFVRKELSARGVTMLPETVDIVDDGLAGSVFITSKTGSGKDMTTFTIKTTWRLTDSETGDTATIQSLGTGADTNDKFSPKAQTNAMKYALLMGFLLSTGDDPEAFDLSDGALADPAIGDSSVSGVRQGGRQSHTTAPQLDAIRRLVAQNNLDADGLLAAIEAAAINGMELTQEQEDFVNGWDRSVPETDKRKAIMAFIGDFPFAQAGKLIRTLEES